MCVAGFGAARGAEERDAERFCKTRRGKTADQPHDDDRDQTGDGDVRRRIQHRGEPRIKQQKLADEAIEWRQTDDRGGAGQKGCAGPWHAFQQPAELFEFQAVRGVLHRPCAEKQQSFEDAVIDDVQQARGEPDHGQGQHSGGEPHHADADPEQDDADILDAAVGQQALEVMLRHRKQHAEHAARRTDRDQQPAPPGLRRAEQGQYANQPVDADLDHRAGHQCRGMARRDRMCFRQPDMHWDDTRLRAKADQRQDENQRCQPGISF